MDKYIQNPNPFRCNGSISPNVAEVIPFCAKGRQQVTFDGPITKCQALFQGMDHLIVQLPGVRYSQKHYFTERKSEKCRCKVPCPVPGASSRDTFEITSSVLARAQACEHHSTWGIKSQAVVTLSLALFLRTTPSLIKPTVALPHLSREKKSPSSTLPREKGNALCPISFSLQFLLWKHKCSLIPK